MRLTRTFKIPYRDDLKEFFEVSKNLYNQSLWTIKQHYKERGEYLNYNALDKIMKQTTNLENCKKRTKSATYRVCIRPLKTLDIRPPIAEMIRPLFELKRYFINL